MLVVYGHTLVQPNTVESIVFSLIYNFHMPLFLILSAMTSRYSNTFKEFLQNVKKSAVRLLLPVVLIYVAYCIQAICINPASFKTLAFLKNGHNWWYGWFFLVLFCSKSIFDYVQLYTPKRMLFIVTSIITLTGVIFGKVETLVFEFNSALAAQFFLYVGYRWKNIKFEKLSKLQKSLLLIAAFILWFVFTLCTYKTSLSILGGIFPVFPICFVVALAGCLLLIELSKIMEKAKIFYPLQFLGRYCIYFYFIHCIDDIWVSWYKITGNNFINFLIRVAINLSFFLVLLGLRFCVLKIIKHYRAKKTAQKI